jgi:hypothetical protein
MTAVRRARAPLWRKFAVAALSALTTLAALEGGLRLATALRSGRVPPTLGPKRLPDGSVVRRVLCLGDSNTYGLYERTEDAWPAQVEALLRERATRGLIFELVNDGFPGQNSSDLRTRCAASLEHADPDLLVVWVGKNNTWSTRNMEPYLGQGSTAAGPPLLRDLRLYRFFRTLEGRHVSERSIDLRDLSRGGGVSGQDAFEIALQYGDGGSDVELALALRALEGDLRAIDARAEERGIPLLVLTYPLDLDRLGALNAKLLELARGSRWRLVDPRAWIAAALRRARYEELFHHDFHLRSRGYAVLARFLAPHCAEALGVPLSLPRPTLADLDAMLGSPARRVAAAPTEAGYRVEASGPPGASYLLLAGRASGEAPGTPLPPYHLLPIELAGIAASGALDERGRAVCEIPSSWAGNALVLATQAVPFENEGEQRFDVATFGLSDGFDLPPR